MEPQTPTVKPSPISGQVLITDKAGKSASIDPTRVTSVETTDGGNTVITFLHHAVTLFMDFEPVLAALASVAGTALKQNAAALA